VLEKDQALEGSGVVIDDEFNFFIGSWMGSQMDGLGLIKLTNDAVVYG